MIIVTGREILVEVDNPAIEPCESCGAPVILNVHHGRPVFEEVRCHCFIAGSLHECAKRIEHTVQRCAKMRGPQPPLVL